MGWCLEAKGTRCVPYFRHTHPFFSFAPSEFLIESQLLTYLHTNGTLCRATLGGKGNTDTILVGQRIHTLGVQDPVSESIAIAPQPCIRTFYFGPEIRFQRPWNWQALFQPLRRGGRWGGGEGLRGPPVALTLIFWAKAHLRYPRQSHGLRVASVDSEKRVDLGAAHLTRPNGVPSSVSGANKTGKQRILIHDRIVPRPEIRHPPRIDPS